MSASARVSEGVVPAQQFVAQLRACRRLLPLATFFLYVYFSLCALQRWEWRRIILLCRILRAADGVLALW